jgi:hypothetical protein
VVGKPAFGHIFHQCFRFFPSFNHSASAIGLISWHINAMSIVSWVFTPNLLLD